MPIQAHALPWASLAAQLEYRPPKSGKPGDQRPRLYARNQETQAQQVRHFAAVSKKVLEEHTGTLRAKFKPPEQYRDRACVWQHSDLGTKQTAESAASRTCKFSEDRRIIIEVQHASSSQAIEDSRILRRRVCHLQNGWNSEQETRSIFSNEFQAMYEPYRYRYSGRMAEFQGIETWSQPETASSLQNIKNNKLKDPDYIAWANARTRSDILKLLIIDIARHDNSWKRTADLDTLLLLKHHPQVNVQQYVPIHLVCCNIHCVIIRLQDLALKFLLFFGILETMIDHGETRLMSQLIQILEPI